MFPADVFRARLDNAGNLVSLGGGIGREILVAAFLKYSQDEVKWFETLTDGFASVKPLTREMIAQYTPERRKEDFAALGAICALMLISNLAPDPIGPCVLQYMPNGCDFSALHEEFVGTWHPEVRSQI